jgi:hypothetical protein
LRDAIWHVLPSGQHRVRYSPKATSFGWMHPAASERRLKVETLLALVIASSLYAEE